MTRTLQLRASIYTRFSRADGDSDSCETQEAMARKAIETEGWRIAHVDRDDGISGREMVHRPGLNRTIDRARSGEYDVLVCRDMDRLFRGAPARVLGVLQQLQDQGIRVWEYTTRSFVEIDGANVIITAVKAHANRSEALKASVRIKEKLRARDEQGTWTGPAPYGYKNQRKRLADGNVGVFIDRRGTVGVLVPHEEEHAVLRSLPELFLRLGSFNAVATELNSRLVRAPNGAAWDGKGVAIVLKNPVYRGIVLRGRRSMTEQAGAIVRTRAEAEDVRRYEQPEWKVWSDETIQKLDALIAARARVRTWSLGERRHLASGFVRCRYCRGSLSMSGARPGARPYYGCGKGRSNGCPGHLGYRPEDAVDGAVIAACMALLTDEVIARTRAIVAQALNARQQTDTRGDESARLRREIGQAEKRARGFEEMAADAEGEERARHRASLREQLDRLAGLREQLRQVATQGPAPDPTVLLTGFDARVAELRSTLAKGGVEALPAVDAILHGQRLLADRRPDGRWDLRGDGDLLAVAEVGSNQKMAPQSPLWTITGMQQAVGDLGVTFVAYKASVAKAEASAKQHAIDLAAQNDGRNANDRSLLLVRALTESGAKSVGDIASMAFVARQGRPAAPPLVPPESIDITMGKKGHGKVKVAAHELGKTRRQYAAQMSPDPVAAGSWVSLPGAGKSRWLTGKSGTSAWVRFALMHAGAQSDWCTPVLVTFP
jgi:DNA invertase Pin-like site-specific DNA recombinase